MTATAFAPGSVGNVGPGFDVLGLAIETLGDRVTVELTDGPARVDSVTGRDADLVPREPKRNAAAVAATAFLRALGDSRNPVVSIDKGLPLSGGLGGSAASSVGGAYAAALALNLDPRPLEIAAAALEGETAVAGVHLDNIAASVLGGLTLVRSVRPIDIVALTVKANWMLAVVTPNVRVETKAARKLLPASSGRAMWVQQMANSAGVVHAFAAGDGALLRRSLDDLYAEPRRASLIPHFNEAKQAAIAAGAFGCVMSGSGPTLVAICEDEAIATAAVAAMIEAFRIGDPAYPDRQDCLSHTLATVSPIARQGVRPA